MNKEKIKEILEYLYSTKDGYTQMMEENLRLCEILEAILEDNNDTRTN